MITRVNNRSLPPLTRRNAMQLIGGGMLAAGSLAAPFGARAASPVRGGFLRIGAAEGGTTDSLDPTTYLSYHMYTVGFTLGNNLVELNPEKQPIPELAESWEGSKDAKRWVFKMRKGVEFHNGKTLTAKDAAWSLNRHIGKKSKSGAKGYLEGITAIRADGDNVIIEHETGNADIPIIMGDYHLQIVPEGFSDWNTFVGTGPYVLERFEPGVRFAATRNPNYWKPDRAWVDRVAMDFMPDPTARISALISGKVGVIDRLETKVVGRIKALHRFQIIETIGTNFVESVMDVRAAPFDSLHVREAIKFGINRQEQLKTVFSGYGVLGNDHPVPPTDPFFNTELPQRPYDPEKARWHLKQAGLDKISVALAAADGAFPGAIDSAVLMQQSANGTGIDIKVERVPNDGYWAKVWMHKPYVMSFWGVRPTPGMMFSAGFACGAPWGEAHWCNDRFQKLLVAGQTEIDFDKRKAIYWDMQEIVHKDGGNAIFAFPADLDAYAHNVHGTKPDAVSRLMGCRIAERVWMT